MENLSQNYGASPATWIYKAKMHQIWFGLALCVIRPRPLAGSSQRSPNWILKVLL